MDRKLEAYLPRGGVFVEAGANDGFQQSNTYYLERFKGWSGLLVEPIPELARRAERERRVPVVNVALVPRGFTEDTVVLRSGGLTSGLPSVASSRPEIGFRGNEVRVPARALSAVLDAAALDHVDFLSLDVEGYEAEVLKGVDFDRHAPGHLLVEIDGDRVEVERVLGDRYTLVAPLSFHDYLYARTG